MKFLIPAVLGSILLIAGIFAFVPVQKASTIHSTIGSVGLANDGITAAKIATAAIGADEIAAGAITVSEAPNLDAAITSRAVPADIDNQNRAAYWQVRAGAGTINLIPAGETISGRLVVSTLAAVAGGTCELRAAGGADDSIAGVSNIAVDTTGAATVAGQNGLDVAIAVALSTCSVGVFLDSGTG